MEKNDNSFIKNAVLLAVGILGLKYILQKISFNPSINVESSDTIIDYAPPIVEIINKLPPAEEEITPNPDDGDNTGGDGDTIDPRSAEPILDYAPVYEKIIHKLPPVESEIKSEIDSNPTYIKKLPDPYPVTETPPITEKSDIISSIKGVFVDMVNELMLGDKTWYYSQQDVINMERLKPIGSSTRNPQCCEFVKNNQKENQLPTKDIFY
ncbi:MAG: hypothetical protein QM503_06570 [Bacteroidota bacterium]